MYAVTFHHMIVGLSAGAGTLMGICAILAWLSNRVSNLESSKSTLDKASYAASILTLVTLPLANLQMLSALFGLTSIMILGSIGSKITLGESTLDLLPFWPEFMNSIVIDQWVSLFLVIIGASSVIISFRMMDLSNKSQI
jgi:hypothetical protein